jgi:hypothetical protein
VPVQEKTHSGMVGARIKRQKAPTNRGLYESLWDQSDYGIVTLKNSSVSPHAAVPA